MAKGNGTNLGELQQAAESAASKLKAARTNMASASAALLRAEEAYVTAQKTLQAGVEQVKASTKVV